MAVPDFQTLMLPVLIESAEGEIRIGDVVERIAQKLGLTPEERAELLPSGVQSLFSNRVHWAKTYLGKAGLIESTRRGHFRITLVVDRCSKPGRNASTSNSYLNLKNLRYFAGAPHKTHLRLFRRPWQRRLQSTPRHPTKSCGPPIGSSTNRYRRNCWSASGARRQSSSKD